MIFWAAMAWGVFFDRKKYRAGPNACRLGRRFLAVTVCSLNAQDWLAQCLTCLGNEKAVFLGLAGKLVRA